MRIWKFCCGVLTVIAAVIATPLYAQQPSDPAKAAPAAQSSSPAEASTTQAADSAVDTKAAADAEAAETAALIAKANANAAAAGKSSAKPADTAAIAKKAKRAGWRAEVKDGNTVYCRDDPQVGSRFSSRRCVNETQLATLMEQAEFDKDQLKQRGCSGSCGGK